MAKPHKISWTDATWNPVRGCSRVSEGCRNCYAERQAARNFPGHRSPTTGEAFAVLTDSGPHWTGKVELIESKLTEPLHWKKPRRVFVNSMSDLFHEALPTRAIVRCFAVMNLTPWITYQILTKRASRMPLLIDEQMGLAARDCASVMIGRVGRRGKNIVTDTWPLPNVWLGVSVEDQPTADARISELLRTPAALRFVSYEPALAEVDFTRWLPSPCYGPNVRTNDRGSSRVLDWIIVGGESGPGARPFDIEWARETIRRCKAAGVPVFVKQLGTRPGYQRKDGWRDIDLKDSKGGNWDEWEPDLRVREFPR